jgi:hypothetical protein
MEQMTLQDWAQRDGGESEPVEAQACERLLGSWRMLVAGDILSGA